MIQNRLKTNLPKNIQVAKELGIELSDLQAYMKKREVFKMMDSVMDAGRRAAVIVSNMLSFSRKSNSGYLSEDIGQLLDNTLELAKSDYNLKKRFDFKQIQIIKNYNDPSFSVKCKASEIQQVFFNILSNGAQAMMSWDKQKDPFLNWSYLRIASG